MTTDQLERRTVAIRRRIEPIEVVVLPGQTKTCYRMSTMPDRTRHNVPNEASSDGQQAGY
jgi:hypothetical protein